MNNRFFFRKVCSCIRGVRKVWKGFRFRLKAQGLELRFRFGCRV